MIKPTQELLKKFTHYNPETGEFKRIGRLSWKGNFINCNFTTKAKTEYGYYQMNIFGRPYLIHRLIFLYMNGELPECDVDHVNGNRTDNRWCNLRLVTRKENLRNVGLRCNNKSGQVGVTDCHGRHRAYIDVDHKRIELGIFDEFNDAVQARKNAEIEHDFHQNHGERPSWQK